VTTACERISVDHPQHIAILGSGEDSTTCNISWHQLSLSLQTIAKYNKIAYFAYPKGIDRLGATTLDINTFTRPYLPTKKEVQVRRKDICWRILDNLS